MTTRTLLHPMRVVAQRTGLTPELVRAWERRYHVVEPKRSPGGQRLYSDDDIEHLRRLHRAVLAGRSIGQVALLDHESLAELVQEDAAAPAASATLPDESAQIVRDAQARTIDAVQRLDGPRLTAILRQAALALPVPVFLDAFVAPLLWDIGERWEDGRLQPVHERFASVAIHHILTWLIQNAHVEPDAPVLAIATPSNQLMELGALMAAASAAALGWRVAWMGPNLPAKDIVLGVETLRPRAIAISLVHQTRDPALHRELEAIARGVAGRATLLVGGRAAPAHALMLERNGAVIMRDLAALRDWLRRHQGTGEQGNRRQGSRGAARG